eukprot:scaffold21760_cov59-Phaeocystis_antarctica.AAC.1
MYKHRYLSVQSKSAAAFHPRTRVERRLRTLRAHRRLRRAHDGRGSGRLPASRRPTLRRRRHLELPAADCRRALPPPRPRHAAALHARPALDRAPRRAVVLQRAAGGVLFVRPRALRGDRRRQPRAARCGLGHAPPAAAAAGDSGAARAGGAPPRARSRNSAHVTATAPRTSSTFRGGRARSGSAHAVHARLYFPTQARHRLVAQMDALTDCMGGPSWAVADLPREEVLRLELSLSPPALLEPAQQLLSTLAFGPARRRGRRGRTAWLFRL